MLETNMKERLEAIRKRDAELNEQMMDPAVLSDRRTMAKVGKEKASYEKTLKVYDEFLELEDFNNQALELIELEDDQEMIELAKKEVKENKDKLESMIEELKVLLLPKDPADLYDAIIEIRGAAGGDEGNIFAGDLYRMYSRYAESLGFKVNVIERSPSESGGYSNISFEVKGEEAYRYFKFESGAHRVQRVPKTETMGRVHTSTATVLVMADIEEDEIELNPNDLVIETQRATGAGGQHVNTTDSAVRITHTPTNIVVVCQDGRSQHDNRDKAMRLIRARVFEFEERKRKEKEAELRQSKIGTGDRSEKIRTYNYPQNRVSDHRIGLTLQKLDIIMEGKLEEIIEALLAQEQKEAMEQR